jgi:hypothetical protein
MIPKIKMKLKQFLYFKRNRPGILNTEVPVTILVMIVILNT